MRSNRRPREMTPGEAETYHRRAVTGLENLGLYDKADDVADLAPEEYAGTKGFEIVLNSQERSFVEMPSKTELEEQVRELEEENDALQDQLDDVMDIVAPEAEEGEEEGDYEEGEDNPD